MRPQSKLALGVLVVAVVGMVAWVGLRVPEPEYREKRLSDWLKGYDSDFLDANTDKAVREIGTNAFPTLIRMLRKTDSAFEIRVLKLAVDLHLIKAQRIPSRDLNMEAARAFFALGAQAKGAVPALIEVFDEARSGDSQSSTALALGYLGAVARQAIPTMLRGSTNADNNVRSCCLNALFSMKMDPDSEMVTLMRALHDPHPAIRMESYLRLMVPELRPAAQKAIPSLITLLSDPDPNVRFVATSIVWNVDRQAATNAGVRP